MLLDERDGETMKAAQLAYGCFEFLHNHRRQPFKRLVEQKQVGIGHQRPTNREQPHRIRLWLRSTATSSVRGSPFNEKAFKGGVSGSVLGSTPAEPLPSQLPKLSRNANRQRLVAFDEIRVGPFRFIDHLDGVKALEDFFPSDAQLQFGKPETETTMDAETERNMIARIFALNFQLVSVIEHVLVAIA